METANIKIIETANIKMPEEIPVSAEVEELARVMCSENGADPDYVERFYVPNRPNWFHFIRDARNAIAARRVFGL